MKSFLFTRRYRHHRCRRRDHLLKALFRSLKSPNCTRKVASSSEDTCPDVKENEEKYELMKLLNR